MTHNVFCANCNKSIWCACTNEHQRHYCFDCEEEYEKDKAAATATNAEKPIDKQSQ